MYHALYDSQLTGRPPFGGDVARIPQTLMKDANKQTRNGYAVAVEVQRLMNKCITLAKTLVESSLPLSFEEEQTYRELADLLDKVDDGVRDRVEGEGEAVNGTRRDEVVDFSQAFYTGGAWEPLLAFVSDVALPTLRKRKRMQSDRKTYVVEIASRCTSILKDLCINVPELGEALGARDRLIALLIESLTVPYLYEASSVLCEELLVSRRSNVFDLRLVANLPDLIRSLPAYHLLLFCRLLSLLAFNPEERVANEEGKPVTSFRLLDQRRSAAVVELSGGDLVTSNHYQLVCAIKEFLARLVQLMEDGATPDEEKQLWLGIGGGPRWRPLSASAQRLVPPPPPTSVLVPTLATSPRAGSSSPASSSPQHHEPTASQANQVSTEGGLANPHATEGDGNDTASTSLHSSGIRRSPGEVLLVCRTWLVLAARHLIRLFRKLRFTASSAMGPAMRLIRPQRLDSSQADLAPPAASSTGGVLSLVTTAVHSLLSRLGLVNTPRSNESNAPVPPQSANPPLGVDDSIPLFGGVSAMYADDTMDEPWFLDSGDAAADDLLHGANDGNDDGNNVPDLDPFSEDNPGDVDDDEDMAMDAQFWGNTLQRELWLMSYRLEIIYVLCTLCLGPYRRMAQDMLAAVNLPAALTVRFDKLSWDPSLDPRHLPPSARFHGAGCECNVHSAFKAQLLRMIHNYCDREAVNWENKSLMFSRQELEALDSWDFASYDGTTSSVPSAWRKIDVQFPPALELPAALLPTEPLVNHLREADALARLKKHGLPVPREALAERGLAWRVVAVVVATNHPENDSSMRFWQYAAIESLLRGAPPKVKMMICSWGVLRSVVEGIFRDAESSEAKQSDEDNRDGSAGVLQTSFDLLGELVKDNPTALKWLSGVETPLLGAFIDKEKNVLERVCEIALKHLIDGNVFLRAVALTLWRNPHDALLDRSREWLLVRNAAKITVGLIMVVTLDEICQDNLCCLNTAVVLLTFARWQNRLEGFVKEITVLDPFSFEVEFTEQFLPLEDSLAVRLRKLMWFWSCYYSCRAIDRNSLQFSSGLDFKELEKTVTEMCRVDREGGSMLTGTQRVHLPYFGTSLPVTTSVALQPWGLC